MKKRIITVALLATKLANNIKSLYVCIIDEI